MDEEIKKNLGRFARNTESMVARSILRWKYKREDKPIPLDHQLEYESRQVASRAHEVIAKRGKNVWNDLIKVYARTKQEKGGQGSER